MYVHHLSGFSPIKLLTFLSDDTTEDCSWTHNENCLLVESRTRLSGLTVLKSYLCSHMQNINTVNKELVSLVCFQIYLLYIRYIYRSLSSESLQVHLL